MNDAINIIKEGKKGILKRKNVPFDLVSFSLFEKELTQIVTNESGLFVIYDASETNTYSSGTIKKALSQWVKHHDNLLKKNLKYAVFIVPSLLTQLTLETVLLVNPSFNHKVFTNTHKAKEWIKNELK